MPACVAVGGPAAVLDRPGGHGPPAFVELREQRAALVDAVVGRAHHRQPAVRRAPLESRAARNARTSARSAASSGVSSSGGPGVAQPHSSCSIAAICSTRATWRPPSNRVVEEDVDDRAGELRRPGCVRRASRRWRRCAGGRAARCTRRSRARRARRAPCWLRSARPGRCRRARCRRRRRPAPPRGRPRRRTPGSRPAPRSRCRGRRPGGPPPTRCFVTTAFIRKPAWSDPMTTLMAPVYPGASSSRISSSVGGAKSSYHSPTA